MCKIDLTIRSNHTFFYQQFIRSTKLIIYSCTNEYNKHDLPWCMLNHASTMVNHDDVSGIIL